MKKLLLPLLILILPLFTPAFAVYAEEDVPSQNVTAQEQKAEENGKSGLASWFDQYIQPLAWIFTSAGLGTVLGICVVAAKVVKTVKALKGSKETYDADLGKAREELNAAVLEFEKHKAEFIEQVSSLQAQIHDEVSSCVTEIKSEVSEIRGEAHKSVEMALVAFGNDPRLVSNGYAKQIAKIARGEDSDVNKSQT